jgi:anti-anti-sigma factor
MITRRRIDRAGLREYLLRIVRECAARLVIELSAVSYADLMGLTVLVRYRPAGAAGGRMLRLAAPGHEVAGTPTTTGLDRQLHLYANVEAAITGTGAV